MKTLALSLALLAGTLVHALAQTPEKPQAALDPYVKHGTLPNGMRYYIRANKLPENRAEFYIVHNVGAILEEDNQNGLAHFTEHMAFNGTTNFPDKSLLNYLETIGCKFGQNVNAFTGTDVTSYNISAVPLTREGITDSCLLILHDWSSHIAFAPKEIDSERGVILEEWRTRNGARARLADKLRPVMYAGSKYAIRNVIGDTAVINHFTHDAIKDFYHKWYRPDLQAVIIVGDFDAEMMEKKVKERLSLLPTPVDAPAKPNFTLPDNTDPLVAIASDPEATSTSINLYFKLTKATNQNNLDEYAARQTTISLIRQMLNARITELLQKENAPCINAYSGYSGYTPDKDAFTLSASPKDNQTLPALELLLTEAFRMQRHGFTSTELERAKANYLRSVESQYLDREKQKHSSYVWDYFGHFTENEPVPGIEYELEFTKKTLPSITLKSINEAAQKLVTDQNIVLTTTFPEKEGIDVPTKTTLLGVIDKTKAMTIAVYDDKLGASKLMETMPKAGTITKEKRNAAFDCYEWTLSNGARVIFKSTNFKEDELLVSALSPGGISYVEDDDVLAASLLPSIVEESGIAGFSSTDLRKLMAGKKANTSVSVSPFYDVVAGNASPKDAETLFQLLNLRFTAPRFDEPAYNAFVSRIKAALAYKALNPMAAFSDSINTIVSSHHPRSKPVTAERMAEVTFDKIGKIYQARFGDAASFTWVITGNIKPEELKPLVETYLSSLPATDKHESYIDRGVRFPQGVAKCHFDKQMQTPKTSTFAFYWGNFKYSANDILCVNTLKHVLDLRYVESIREKEGGSYGVSVRGGYQEHPLAQCYIQLSFDTAPEKADRLVELLHAEFQKLVENGPSADDLQKAKEFFIKSHQDQVKENSYWMSTLADSYIENIDLHTDYDKQVNKLTSKTVKEFSQNTFNAQRFTEVIMIPAKQNEK